MSETNFDCSKTSKSIQTYNHSSQGHVYYLFVNRVIFTRFML